MNPLTEWEYDPEYYFDYDNLDEEEQYTFQAMQAGAYKYAIQRVHAALYFLASIGFIKRDADWRGSSRDNRVSMYFFHDDRYKYIDVMCYEDRVEIAEFGADNPIVVVLEKSDLVGDTDRIVDAILSV